MVAAACTVAMAWVVKNRIYGDSFKTLQELRQRVFGII